jgi:hypothetical protein
MLFLTFGSMMSIGGWISDRVVRSYGRRAGYRIVGAGGLGLGVHGGGSHVLAARMVGGFGRNLLGRSD